MALLRVFSALRERKVAAQVGRHEAEFRVPYV